MGQVAWYYNKKQTRQRTPAYQYEQNSLHNGLQTPVSQKQFNGETQHEVDQFMRCYCALQKILWYVSVKVARNDCRQKNESTNVLVRRLHHLHPPSTELASDLNRKQNPSLCRYTFYVTSTETKIAMILNYDFQHCCRFTNLDESNRRTKLPLQRQYWYFH